MLLMLVDSGYFEMVWKESLVLCYNLNHEQLFRWEEKQKQLGVEFFLTIHSFKPISSLICLINAWYDSVTNVQCLLLISLRRDFYCTLMYGFDGYMASIFVCFNSRVIDELVIHLCQC